MRQPTLYMLVGTPYSGKSTWAADHLKDHPQTIVIDTDKYLEDKAAELGITYNEAFQKFSKDAEKDMYDRARQAAYDLRDIIWDQTNMTVKSRARKLALIPGTYIKTAIIFAQPSKGELAKRVALRTEKPISQKIIDSMLSTYQPPTRDEGFLIIFRVNND